MRRQAMAWSIQLALMGVAASAAPRHRLPLRCNNWTRCRSPARAFRAPRWKAPPRSVINAEQIRSSGFTSVPDVLRAMTQNGGETQSQQSSSGADFSPGAQQVDLRGLGPNHAGTGQRRRIADFDAVQGPQQLHRRLQHPLGMIERIEVLTGSASAIYGSDAIAGVVNFI